MIKSNMYKKVEVITMNETKKKEYTNMLNRKDQREIVIIKLYEYDLLSQRIIAGTNYDFIDDSVKIILENLEKIDEIISLNLTNWSIKRLNYVDRAILRFAVYELYYTETPYEIVINEALNLTRKFTDVGDDKMVGFTNRVLENINEYLKK
ncbi:MAG: transcription antitermination factor NusB [Candidatus Izemoplasma sp.]